MHAATLPNSAEADRLAGQGKFYQLSMAAMFIALVVLVTTNVLGYSDAELKQRGGPWVILPGLLADGVFVWCCYVLYVRGERTQRLITTGPFRYSRHPMYLSLFVMGATFLLYAPSVSALLVFGWFVGLLAVAGRFQERETLARFGQAAYDYYAQTPRFLGWPRRAAQQ